MEFLSPRLLAAYEFGAKAHEGQYRKSPGHIPYFSHPAAVAHILQKAGFSEDVVIAGLLHDVIEDTRFGEGDIRDRFGERVLELVLGVTENKKLKWDDRNQGYNDHLRTMDAETAAISAADLLANRQSILMEFKNGGNPWLSFSKNPKGYSEKRLAFDRERIAIIKEILRNPVVDELEKVEAEVVDLTSKIQWSE
jgi:guanosine-3',5'-bis(diphosphate) 3'-pyrophosphohydrolase